MARSLRQLVCIFIGALQGTRVDGVISQMPAAATKIIRSHTRKRANVSAQSVHWVFTTDCSAYQFNQGNLFLSSAYHVEQPGEFTWVTNGCSHAAQKDAFKMLAHPRANVWHAPDEKDTLVNPRTGKPYAPFQASNRPISIAAWYEATNPKEDAIAIVDPDMMWLRRVDLVDTPAENAKEKKGAWAAMAPKPKLGTGARYGQGCVPDRFNDSVMLDICGDVTSCVAAKNANTCSQLYASGPPWIMHKSDAKDIIHAFPETAVKVHEAYPELLAEQVSYGVTQMRFDVKNALDTFWFLSDTGDGNQPWKAVSLMEEYDPCHERAPPSTLLALPPLWHSCSTYEIPHMLGQGFRLHKDHIHKDILECDAPLLHYPPQDALQRYKGSDSKGFRETWAVCAYTNLVNFHASQWKKRFCDKPSLLATFAYPDHAQSFLNESSWLKKVFRKGGWTDVDYSPTGLQPVSS